MIYTVDSCMIKLQIQSSDNINLCPTRGMHVYIVSCA